MGRGRLQTVDTRDFDSPSLMLSVRSRFQLPCARSPGMSVSQIDYREDWPEMAPKEMLRDVAGLYDRLPSSENRGRESVPN
jgi:hypothetical protein